MQGKARQGKGREELPLIYKLCALLMPGIVCRWEPRGGKSNSFFAKTRDDRFIVKQLSAAERKSFQELAPNFFGYLGRAMRRGQPTCLAKIMGVFTVRLLLHGTLRQHLRASAYSLCCSACNAHVCTLSSFESNCPVTAMNASVCSLMIPSWRYPCRTCFRSPLYSAIRICKMPLPMPAFPKMGGHPSHDALQMKQKQWPGSSVGLPDSHHMCV